MEIVRRGDVILNDIAGWTSSHAPEITCSSLINGSSPISSRMPTTRYKFIVSHFSVMLYFVVLYWKCYYSFRIKH